jgi:hypothetical protein
VGLWLRWRGHDPLERSRDASRASYWVAVQPQRSTQSYFKQF